jgi:hypothetical protein
MDQFNLPTKLSNVQLYILLTTHTSGSPAAAYMSLTQTPNTSEAIKILDKMGYIDVSHDGIELTQTGEQYLTDGNYINGDVLSPTGVEIMKQNDPSTPPEGNPSVPTQQEKYVLMKTMLI